MENDAASAPPAAPPEFEVIAAGLEEKYGAGSSQENHQQQGDPAAPGPAPYGQVISPKTVEAFLVSILTGFSKVYGEHWAPSEMDRAVLVPVYVSAIDEQAPRWFADSPNRALYLCLLVTVLWVLSRAQNGAKVIEWLTSKAGSLVSRVAGTTKTGSPA